MSMIKSSLFANLPDVSLEERMEDLLILPGMRIERIVSGGHASPKGFWYDQAADEWVMVARGWAVLKTADDNRETRLEAGEWVFIPSGLRHRVEQVSDDAVWLAVHVNG